MSIILSAILAVNPVHAAIDAATPRQDLRLELRRICKRESRCRASVREHVGDHWAGRRMWEGAVRRGWLRPDECPEHEMGRSGRWAPRGGWGVSPAWTVGRFAGECTGPEAHDDPEQAARLTVAWIEHLGAYGADTCPKRTRLWVGPRTFDRRPWLAQAHTVSVQCGSWGALAWAAGMPVRAARGALAFLADLA